VSPSSAHDIDFAPTGARCLVISLDGETPAPARSVYLRDPWLLRLVAGLGRAAGRGDAAAPLAFEELLDELLAQIARRRGARAFREPPPWLVTARVRVREAEGRVTLAELSGALGVHRAHLARAFRDHYGTTIGTYARRLRVQRAVAMIQLRDLPLA